MEFRRNRDYRATSDTLYEAERSTTVYSGNPVNWVGKVGLMYPSDYGYAALASSCARTYQLESYASTSCVSSNWLKTDSSQWLLAPRSSSSSIVFHVNHVGNTRDDFSAHFSFGVRPTVYLKSNIAVMGGTGTYSDPYIISAS